MEPNPVGRTNDYDDEDDEGAVMSVDASSDDDTSCSTTKAVLHCISRTFSIVSERAALGASDPLSVNLMCGMKRTVATGVDYVRSTGRSAKVEAIMASNKSVEKKGVGSLEDFSAGVERIGSGYYGQK